MAITVNEYTDKYGRHVIDFKDEAVNRHLTWRVEGGEISYDFSDNPEIEDDVKYDNAYRLLRVNRIGQGWNIGTYRTSYEAGLIAVTLASVKHLGG